MQQGMIVKVVLVHIVPHNDQSKANSIHTKVLILHNALLTKKFNTDADTSNKNTQTFQINKNMH